MLASVKYAHRQSGGAELFCKKPAILFSWLCKWWCCRTTLCLPLHWQQYSCLRYHLVQGTGWSGGNGHSRVWLGSSGSALPHQQLSPLWQHLLRCTSSQHAADKELVREQEVSANIRCCQADFGVWYLWQKEETAALDLCFLFSSEQCFFPPFGKLLN